MNSKDELTALLTKDVNDWKFTDCVAIHSSGIRWWIANGLMSFRVDSSEHGIPDLGYWNTRKLYKWLEEAKRIQYINRLKCAE